MLMVSKFLSVARGASSGDGLVAAFPARFQPAERRAPVVVWNVVSHCNMTCPHCYAAASIQPSRNDLSTTEALRVVDDLADAGVEVLILSGGEPLLRPDLLQLAERAAGHGMMPMLSSNGVLLDAPTAQRLADVGCRYVGISVDGLRDFNDPYRGLEGAFDDALDGLRAAGAAGMRTGMRITVTQQNRDHVLPVLAVAGQVPVDRFYVSHLVYAGRGKRLVQDDLAPSEAREMLHQLFEVAAEQLDDPDAPRIVTGSNDSDGPALLRWIEQRYGHAASERVLELLEARGGNSAGEGVINIDARGRVHPDQFWRTLTLGDVREQRFADILRHPMVAQLRDRTRYLRGRCGSCSYVDICRGSHRERAEAAHGDMWAADPSCVMTDHEVAAIRKTA